MGQEETHAAQQKNSRIYFWRRTSAQKHPPSLSLDHSKCGARRGREGGDVAGK
jgi:hypothetical protein